MKKENKIITQFHDFSLSPEMMRALAKLNFQTPSPVQEAAIKPMLNGQDLLVQAPTGIGKTAAFGIPAIENTATENRHIQTVILCPTRELVVQTASVLKQLAAYKQGMCVLALYGGEPIQKQIIALRRCPQIIVATPGRMMDHMERRTVKLAHVSRVALDEADRMLDMGFREDIGTILQAMPKERQTVLFSATISDEIRRIATAHQHDAAQIRIKQETLAVDTVKQYYTEIRGKTKTPVLLKLLEEKKFGLCLVFVSTKAMADELATQLSEAGHPASSIHGDLRQSQRDKVMKQYRDGKLGILVATDVAARGIDVGGIDAVINYDIPGDSDSYVHRIGRTGRANRAGEAYTFIYPKERDKLSMIMTNTKAEILPLLAPAIPLPKREAFVPEKQPPAKAFPNKPSGNKFSGHKAYGQKPSGHNSYGKKSWKKKRSYEPVGA